MASDLARKIREAEIRLEILREMEERLKGFFNYR
jgi:hypothetical protein